MPIQACTLSGGGKGYKFGSSGHCYASRQDAIKQMKAEYYNGYKGKGLIDETIASLTDQEFNDLLADSKIPLVVRVELAQAKNKIKTP